MIRLSPVNLGSEEERLVLEVLRSGRLVQGPKVEEFEDAFRGVAGAAHAVAVSSGTAALVLALEGLGIGDGDEVVTTPFTFAATLNAILAVGAVVRFADVLEEDLTIDHQAIEAAVTPRTAAILPVHLYGQPADMEPISKIASGHDLAVIEDAAQAAGARVGDRPVGSFGIGCFSFYATKNLTTGEGGMVTTDDDALADRLRLLRSQGMRVRYEYELPGHNFRMTEVHAAIGLPQVAQLPKRNEARRRNAARLNEGLGDLNGVIVPRWSQDRYHVFHQYTIRLRPPAPGRQEVARALSEQGIETGVYYPRAVYDYPCYRTHRGVRLEPMPVAERAAGEVLSLPVHPWLTDDDLVRIVDAVRDVVLNPTP